MEIHFPLMCRVELSAIYPRSTYASTDAYSAGRNAQIVRRFARLHGVAGSLSRFDQFNIGQHVDRGCTRSPSLVSR